MVLKNYKSRFDCYDAILSQYPLYDFYGNTIYNLTIKETSSSTSVAQNNSRLLRTRICKQTSVAHDTIVALTSQD